LLFQLFSNIWIDCGRRGDVGRCTDAVALFALGAAAGIKSPGIVGIELDRLVEVRAGAIVVPLVVVGDASAVEGAGQPGIELDRLAEVRDRVVVG